MKEKDNFITKERLRERIDDKIKDIERYLEELEEVKADNFKECEFELKTKAACEHYFEKIIEACEDVAFLLLRLKDLRFPDKEESVFNTLYEKKLISTNLHKQLQEAKKMRNKITHQYDDISDEIVFDAISGELQKDVEKFLDVVRGLR